MPRGHRPRTNYNNDHYNHKSNNHSNSDRRLPYKDASGVSRKPRPLQHGQPLAAPTYLALATNQTDYTTSRLVFWCPCPADKILVKFADPSILRLVQTEQGESVPTDTAGEIKVVVPGLCPFHMVGTKDTDQAGLCGGFHEHVHSRNTLAMKESLTDDSLVLRHNLVTAPMPLDILIKSPELRTSSLYVYKDRVFTESNAGQYQALSQGAVLEPGFDNKQHLEHYPNPTYRRLEQQLAMEHLWKLDEEYTYSLEEWMRKIGSSNVFLYRTRNQAPYPPDKRFRSSPELYKVSFGFWTDFQQEMWRYFLENDTGPCYLDAVYQPSINGFQIWTLFFERNSQPVPISYLITTGVAMKLISDWLLDIVQTTAHLPKKTLYANILKSDLLQPVFETWDIKYSMYYIAQSVRKHILRKTGARSETLKQAARNINSDFVASLATIKKQSTESAFDFFLDDNHRWIPRITSDLDAFYYSADAVCRWRFLLWKEMLGRPSTTRIDSVLYYLVDVIEPLVNAAIDASAGMDGNGEPFGLDGIEFGDDHGYGQPRMHRCKIDRKLFYVFKHGDLQSKTITDTSLNVCYCERFMRHGFCGHLVFCASDDIHQPHLPEILNEIPDA